MAAHPHLYALIRNARQRRAQTSAARDRCFGRARHMHPHRHCQALRSEISRRCWLIAELEGFAKRRLAPLPLAARLQCRISPAWLAPPEACRGPSRSLTLLEIPKPRKRSLGLNFCKVPREKPAFSTRRLREASKIRLDSARAG